MPNQPLYRRLLGWKPCLAGSVLAVAGVALNAAIAQPPGPPPWGPPPWEQQGNQRGGQSYGNQPQGGPGGHGHRHEPMEVVDLPEPEVSITVEGEYRVIRANGLPNHETGEFPSRGNPNALRPQQHEVKIPLKPKAARRPTEARPEFGIALNGVIFDSGTGEFWVAGQGRSFGGGSPWNYEAIGGSINLGIDHNHAHVQPTGKYHYHGTPVGLLESLGATESTPRMVQVGWAYDGFPIYGPWGYSDANDAYSEVKKLKSSYRLKEGNRPSGRRGPGGEYDGTFGLDYEYVKGSGDLDECNGRTGVTPEFPEGTYYYVVTEEYPNVPRMWRGTPDRSSRRRPPGPPPGMMGGQQRGGQQRGGQRGGWGGQQGPGGWPPPPPPPHGGYGQGQDDPYDR